MKSDAYFIVTDIAGVRYIARSLTWGNENRTQAELHDVLELSVLKTPAQTQNGRIVEIRDFSVQPVDAALDVLPTINVNASSWYVITKESSGFDHVQKMIDFALEMLQAIRMKESGLVQAVPSKIVPARR